MTAVLYNQIHASVISAIGLALLGSQKLSAILALRCSAVLFIIGTVLFSFSIYASVSLDIPGLVNVTPVGGLTIMTAWLLLVISGFLAGKQ